MTTGEERRRALALKGFRTAGALSIPQAERLLKRLYPCPNCKYPGKVQFLGLVRNESAFYFRCSKCRRRWYFNCYDQEITKEDFTRLCYEYGDMLSRQINLFDEKKGK